MSESRQIIRRAARAWQVRDADFERSLAGEGVGCSRRGSSRGSEADGPVVSGRDATWVGVLCIAHNVYYVKLGIAGRASGTTSAPKALIPLQARPPRGRPSHTTTPATPAIPAHASSGIEYPPLASTETLMSVGPHA